MIKIAACIYDGIRMHIGKRFPFEHNDIESFEKQIKKAEVVAEETGGGILVITEGVFGMQESKAFSKRSLPSKINITSAYWLMMPTVSVLLALPAPALAKSRAYRIRSTFTSAPLQSLWLVLVRL